MSSKNIKNIPNNIVVRQGYSGFKFPLKLSNLVPTIIVQPSPFNRRVISSRDVKLSVLALGVNPLTYQWYKNDLSNLIPGATGSEFTLSNVTSLSEGFYFVQIRNPLGFVNSENVNITVLRPAGIVSGPQSLTALYFNDPERDKFTLTVTPSGSPVFTFSWLKNDSLISGATLSSYTANFNFGDLEDTLNYKVFVLNDASVSAVSAEANVTIFDAPLGFVSEPGAPTPVNPSFSSITFTAEASGRLPITYQWRKNGTNMLGLTTESITLFDIQEVDEALYDVVISNLFGVANTNVSLTSNQVFLFVNDPVGVITPLEDITYVVRGETITLSALVSGTEPYAFQWFSDDAIIPGATLSTLEVSLEDYIEGNTFYYTVSNVVNETTSNTTTIAEYISAEITYPVAPEYVNLIPGEFKSLHINTRGTMVEIEWRRNGQTILGETTDTLNLINVQESDEGEYIAVASNKINSVSSSPWYLSVYDPVGVIEPIEDSLSGVVGTIVTLSAYVSGSEPVAYKWYKDGALILNETLTSYTFTLTGGESAGAYYYTASNMVNTVTSNFTQVTVLLPVEILEPISTTYLFTDPNISATLSVVVSGTAPQYQWRKSNVDITDATAPTYTIENVQETDEDTYDVVVYNMINSVTSVPFVLSVNDPVGVVVPLPNSFTSLIGTTITLTAQVSGTEPIVYQWYKNGSLVLDATASTYSFTPDAEVFGETYYYTATNFVTITSNVFSLTAGNLAGIISPTETINISANPGGSVTLSANVSGTEPISYQWWKSGSMITTATASSYSILDLQEEDQSNYQVVVTNIFNSVSSATFNVFVNDPVNFTLPVSGNEIFLPETEVILYAVVSGSPPIEYQWYRNSNPIIGANSSSYTISSITPQEDGDRYRLIATNMVNSVSSNTVRLSVYQPVNITTQPSNIISAFDATSNEATFNIVVTGSQPYNYNWYKNNTLVYSGSSSYTVDSDRALSTSDFGTYFATVSNIVQTVTSNNVVLSGSVPLIVLETPTNITAMDGTTVEFRSNAAGGDGNILYQWYRNNSLIEGATASNYMISPVSADVNDGTYKVNISSVRGQANPEATLTALPKYEVWNFDLPASEPVYAGSFNGSSYLSSTGSTTTNSRFNIAGNVYTIEGYFYCNTLNSEPQTIVGKDGIEGVCTPQYNIEIGPTGALSATVGDGAGLGRGVTTICGPTITLSSWHHFAVTYSSTTDIFRLFFDGQLTNEVTLTHDVWSTTTKPLFIGYKPGQTNPFNGYISNIRFVRNQRLYDGNFTPSKRPLTLTTVGATGSGVPTNNFTTGIVELLTMQNSTLTDSSTSVVKTFATVGTPVAVLTRIPFMDYVVLDSFTVTTTSGNLLYISWGDGEADTNVPSGSGVTHLYAPVSAAAFTAPLTAEDFVNIGESVTFNAFVTGTTPITYNWYKNGTQILGANLSSYTINNITIEENNSSYYVIASNIVNSVTSNTVLLSVYQPSYYNLTNVNNYNGTGTLTIHITGAPTPDTTYYVWDGINDTFEVTTMGGYTSTNFIYISGDGYFNFELRDTPAGGGTLLDSASAIISTAVYTVVVNNNYDGTAYINATVTNAIPNTVYYLYDGTNIASITANSVGSAGFTNASYVCGNGVLLTVQLRTLPNGGGTVLNSNQAYITVAYYNVDVQDLGNVFASYYIFISGAPSSTYYLRDNTSTSNVVNVVYNGGAEAFSGQFSIGQSLNPGDGYNTTYSLTEGFTTFSTTSTIYFCYDGWNSFTSTYYIDCQATTLDQNGDGLWNGTAYDNGLLLNGWGDKAYAINGVPTGKAILVDSSDVPMSWDNSPQNSKIRLYIRPEDINDVLNNNQMQVSATYMLVTERDAYEQIISTEGPYGVSAVYTFTSNYDIQPGERETTGVFNRQAVYDLIVVTLDDLIIDYTDLNIKSLRLYKNPADGGFASPSYTVIV